ncbi:condensin subunit ScpB [Mariprofundus ferrinatatus]|uniref:Condensin subunit ScpB n=1 Tax=Mariprofundus ferrinatatus TaxID=1921087 RepID=A0A2K8LBS3_9PROT|nr:SMC-Scp complex subunit ScpB [Mariprofundus ferrinatatus]ATX81696.1 condensin subunit ScpB [Mariprofundus ferrinatatus]
MNSSILQLTSQIEAVLLASDEPVSIARLRSLLGDDVQSSDIREAISTLEADYHGRGIRPEMVAGGWQFRTAPEHAELIHAMWEIKPQRLSRSSLETLAIIAYRQPTTRAEIEALRGVKVSSQMIATLQERGWVKVLGRKEVPGRPHLYGTGRQFLIDFGLESLKDLPESAQLMDEDEIQQMVMENIEQHTDEHEPEESEESAETEEPEQIEAAGG